ncbi:hypothetical protein GCL60_11100 [Silvanigrella paludirubra]|jgi:endonuclease III|uniref:Uncharacterized protein n=1 Tax=Silvanigrella paludirubra TaxID=2499159 RepID=A0A6N6VQU6_9BACT|nr:hypothetical protein [Silvanigrella paludirubra]KAB8037712.1 hypothetical protein GCL60_11100 [Silvanigrella paludirubra]
MSNHNFSFDWKKIQETLSDAAKISTREIKRGVDEAKKQIGKVQLVQKRKELFAELGRNLYEAYEDGLPEELEKLLKDTELYEIIQDIQNTDKELIKLRGVDKG